MRLFIYLILFLISYTLYSKTKSRSYFREKWPREYLGQESPRWFWGGSMFVQPLDSNGYKGFVSPSIAYRAGNRSIFICNLGLSYYQEKIFYINSSWPANKFYKYQAANYEASLAWRYFFYWRFFTHLGLSEYNQKITTSITYNSVDDIVTENFTRENIMAAPLGLGYVQPIGQNNSSVVITCLYDILQNRASPYRGKPIIRAGFNFGL